MQLKCLIVEDEKLAQDVLKKYINLIPSLQLVATFGSASEAISYLHSAQVDLILLDITMPELSGIEFLKTLRHPPAIIITTAHPEYALEGYEYSVYDYLLKPIRYERFVKAINKVIDLHKKQVSDPAEAPSPENDFIFLKEDDTVHQIPFTDLLYVQAFGNYLKVFTKAGKLIVIRNTLMEIESQLPSSLFLRIHKSYLVSIRSIEKIKHNEVYIADKVLPLGTTYKQEVMKVVNRL